MKRQRAGSYRAGDDGKVVLELEEYLQLTANRRQLGSMGARVRVLAHHVERLDSLLDQIERQVDLLQACPLSLDCTCGDSGDGCPRRILLDVLADRPRL
jgi:hypothetical protein